MKNNIYRKLLVFILVTITPVICFADNFTPGSSYAVCFTPGNNCSGKIIDLIDQAKKQILVQAYNFTDVAIADALVKCDSHN